MTSLTYGIFRSWCGVWLLTYHGELVNMQRICDRLLWMIEMLDLLAQPYSSLAYIQIGWMIALYNNNLFSGDMLDRLPIVQLKIFTFRSTCFRFLTMCSCHDWFFSRCILKYFVLSAGRIGILFTCIGEQCSRFNAKVTCADLFSFILIPHFCSHVWIWFKWFCSVPEVIAGSERDASITVSSTNVPMLVFMFTGKSTVYNRQSKRLIALPRGTPDFMENLSLIAWLIQKNWVTFMFILFNCDTVVTEIVGL